MKKTFPPSFPQIWFLVVSPTIMGWFASDLYGWNKGVVTPPHRRHSSQDSQGIAETYRRTEKTRAIFPMALILFLMISLRTFVPAWENKIKSKAFKRRRQEMLRAQAMPVWSIYLALGKRNQITILQLNSVSHNYGRVMKTNMKSGSKWQCDIQTQCLNERKKKERSTVGRWMLARATDLYPPSPALWNGFDARCAEDGPWIIQPCRHTFGKARTHWQDQVKMKTSGCWAVLAEGRPITQAPPLAQRQRKKHGGTLKFCFRPRSIQCARDKYAPFYYTDQAWTPSPSIQAHGSF